MSKSHWKQEHLSLNINDLYLDIKNPRVDTGKRLTHNALIQELLHEDVLTLASEIAKEGYLAVSTLMVVEEGEKKIVVDGNRRLLAVKILNNPEIINAFINEKEFKKIKTISDSKTEDVSTLMAVVYPTRKDAEREMAALHLTGLAVKQWKPIRQYRYFQNKLVNEKLLIDDLSKILGIKQDDIKKGVKTFQLYELAQKNIPSLINEEGKSIYSDDVFKTDKFQKTILNEEGERFLGYSFSEEDKKIVIVDNENFFSRLALVLKEIFDPSAKYLYAAQFNASDRLLFFQSIDSNFLKKSDYAEAIKAEEQKKLSGQEKLFQSAEGAQATSNSESLTAEASTDTDNKKINIFVITAFEGLDEVFQVIKSTAEDLFHEANTFRIDGVSGARQSQDQKIERAIEGSDVWIAILSMGNKELAAYKAIRENDDAGKILEKFFPINHNVLVELGYAIKCAKATRKEKDLFLIVEDKDDGDLPTLKNFCRGNFFDIRQREQITYKNTSEISEKLTTAFKASPYLSTFIR